MVHFSLIGIGKTKGLKVSRTKVGAGLGLGSPRPQSGPPVHFTAVVRVCEGKDHKEADVCGNGVGWLDTGNLVKGEAVAPSR